ncbi:MAG: SEL1-like repeat protein [Bacteroidales bacterium]|nr:SEL1-like repeat protein [Bacteroidales bacterium]
MKTSTLILTLLSLAMSAQLFAANKINPQRRYVKPEEVHVTVSDAARQKANALYESVHKAYTQGKLSTDAVVDKALYHGAWSPELEARCLQLVADKNDRAKAELGHLYTYYKTAYLFPNMESEGLRLMETAAANGYKPANDYLGIYYNRKKDYAKALKYFQAAGSDHIPYAYTLIGEMYDKGEGVKKDRSKAIELYRRAALLGDAKGAAKYGSALQRQWYGKVNMPDAFVWTYLAGELGDDFSRSNLQLPLRGERFGDDRNTASIRNSLTLVSGFNDVAGHPLKDEPIYKQGYAAGLAARTAAAENGDDWSLFYLGSMSYNDEFLNHSGDFIRKCYEPIIASGKLPKPAMALVYERMAELYRKGDGVKANPAKAAEYARKAADSGSAAAYKIVEQIPD